MPLIFTAFSIISFCIGVFIGSQPKEAIELQRRFYARINWKIEPISMEKEIRNTRIMGLSLIIFSIATLTFTLANKALF